STLYAYPLHITSPTYIHTLSLHDALPILVTTVLNRPVTAVDFENLMRAGLLGGPTGDAVGNVQSAFSSLFLRDVPLDEKDWRKRSEEHTSELQSRFDIVCRLLLEKKK